MTRSSTYPQQHFVAAFSMLLIACSGCVALNLPSDRFHDPNDDGGLFGDWRTKRLDPIGNWATEPVGLDRQDPCGDDCQSGEDCLLGEPLSLDPFDTSQGQYAKHEEPEVPWPRFHPVPTRPVFGGSQP